MNSKRALVTTGDSAHIQRAWAERQKKLKRNSIALPDLTHVIHPNHEQTRHIIKRMGRFDMNRGGFAANTVKSMCWALRKWRDYCIANQIYAFPLAEDAHFELFLQAMVLSEYSISTTQQIRSLLSIFYEYLEIENPATGRDIAAFIKTLKEDHIDLTGNAYVQKQATALRRHHISKLYDLNDHQPIDRHFFKNVRDVAFIAAAYATCLRMSEIRHLKKRHVIVEGDSKVRVLRTRSKTSINVREKLILDEEARRFLSYFNRVKDKFDDEHYLFSHITSSYKTVTPDIPLSSSVTIEIFKRQCRRLKKAGYLDMAYLEWSAHSCRIGRIQDLKELDNATDLELQRAGEWTTMRMVSLYLRGLVLGDETSSKK